MNPAAAATATNLTMVVVRIAFMVVSFAVADFMAATLRRSQRRVCQPSDGRSVSSLT
jgi:hypothetical protein